MLNPTKDFAKVEQGYTFTGNLLFTEDFGPDKTSLQELEDFNKVLEEADNVEYFKGYESIRERKIFYSLYDYTDIDPFIEKQEELCRIVAHMLSYKRGLWQRIKLAWKYIIL